jgi:hypothetical protein
VILYWIIGPFSRLRYGAFPTLAKMGMPECLVGSGIASSLLIGQNRGLFEFDNDDFRRALLEQQQAHGKAGLFRYSRAA